MDDKNLKIKRIEKSESEIDEEKRDFLFLTTTGLAVGGVALAGWTLIDTMNPAKDVLALASTEVDLSPIEEGQGLTVNLFLFDTEPNLK